MIPKKHNELEDYKLLTLKAKAKFEKEQLAKQKKININSMDKLNEIHAVSYSTRYWRIIIGPWLGYFIQGMFDKWQNLIGAFENYSVSQTIMVDFPREKLIPNDMNSFIKLFSSDEWNHYCYNQILFSFESKFSFSKKIIPPFSLNEEINTKVSAKDRIIIGIKKVLNLFKKLLFMSLFARYS